MKIPVDVADFLEFPFYKLHYIDNLDSFVGLSAREVLAIQEEYDPKVFEGVVAALRWVLAHPEAELTELTPELTHLNSQLHRYAALVLDALQA